MWLRDEAGLAGLRLHVLAMARSINGRSETRLILPHNEVGVTEGSDLI